MKSSTIAEELNPVPYNLIPLNTPPSLSLHETPHVKVSHLPDKEEPLGAHKHSYFEILFIEENQGWYQVGHHKIWAMPGDLFLIVPDEVHDPSSLEGTKNWSIMFEADVLASGQTNADIFLMLPDELLLLSFLQFKGTATKHFQVALIDRPRWLARLKQLEHELHGQPLNLSETARVLLRLLLIDTARLVAPELRKCSLHRPLLTNVLRFIKTHYYQQISLCDVAKAVGRSSAYLTDFVRRETGRTVLSWIIECRIAEARRLLLVTNQLVHQIAETVGYLDTGHFIRQFRRVNGLTPETWRHVNRSLARH
jgi:AraC-like DNA-binding protein